MTVMDGFKTRVTRLIAKYSIPAAAKELFGFRAWEASLSTLPIQAYHLIMSSLVNLNPDIKSAIW